MRKTQEKTMNDLSISPLPEEFLTIERRARELRARAVANAGRKTWSRLSGLFRH